MENSDKLKEFVDLHSEQFDCFEPSDKLWGKIEAKQKINQRKHTMFRSLMKVAAAIVLLFGTYITINKGLLDSDNFVANNNIDSTTNTQIAEFQEAQSYYNNEINTKLQDLKQNAKQYPDILNDTYNELHALDIEYKNLQNDLQNGIQNKEIVSAMIQNYKFKLEIIDQINEVINEHEAQKNVSHHDI